MWYIFDETVNITIKKKFLSNEYLLHERETNMKQLKKVFLVMLSMAVVVGTTACGSRGGSNDNAANDTSTQQEGTSSNNMDSNDMNGNRTDGNVSDGNVTDDNGGVMNDMGNAIGKLSENYRKFLCGMQKIIFYQLFRLQNGGFCGIIILLRVCCAREKTPL